MLPVQNDMNNINFLGYSYIQELHDKNADLLVTCGKLCKSESVL